jgi:hypothetical protein
VIPGREAQSRKPTRARSNRWPQSRRRSAPIVPRGCRSNTPRHTIRTRLRTHEGSSMEFLQSPHTSVEVFKKSSVKRRTWKAGARHGDRPHAVPGRGRPADPENGAREPETAGGTVGQAGQWREATHGVVRPRVGASGLSRATECAPEFDRLPAAPHSKNARRVKSDRPPLRAPALKETCGS